MGAAVVRIVFAMVLSAFYVVAVHGLHGVAGQLARRSGKLGTGGAWAAGRRDAWSILMDRTTAEPLPLAPSCLLRLCCGNGTDCRIACCIRGRRNCKTRRRQWYAERGDLTQPANSGRGTCRRLQLCIRTTNWTPTSSKMYKT